MAKQSRSKPEPLSFEDALRELEEITRALEGGSLSLDDSIKAYEKGMELRQVCSSMLEQAEKKLQTLEQKSSGEVSARPMDGHQESDDPGAPDAAAGQSSLFDTED